jgi:hypothetical protein
MGRAGPNDLSNLPYGRALPRVAVGTMSAEQGRVPEQLGDCAHCRSAGSVRAGRCQICDWEAAVAPPAPVRVQVAAPDGGTLTTTGG